MGEDRAIMDAPTHIRGPDWRGKGVGSIWDTQSYFSFPVLELQHLTPTGEHDIPTCGLSTPVKGEARFSSKFHFNVQKEARILDF